MFGAFLNVKVQEWNSDDRGRLKMSASSMDGTESVDRAALAGMLDGLNLYGMGASWGGFESLIVPANPAENRTATKWDENGQLLRVHAGLEDIDDLICDLGAGLDRLTEISDL